MGTQIRNTRTSPRPVGLKRRLEGRLNRIEGQVRAVAKLVRGDAYCDDVLNLISSVRAALTGAAGLVLENHLKNCVTGRIRSGDTEVVDETLTILKKFMK